MSRVAARFTEADIRRAIRAAKKEGMQVAVDILPDGTIRLVPAQEFSLEKMCSRRGVML